MNGQLSKKIWAIVTVVLCVLAIICIALFITINLSPLFLHFPSASQLGATRSQTYADYGRLLCYLQQPWPTRLHLGTIPLSSRALHHFQDVRHLILFAETIGGFSLITSCWLLGKQKRRGQLWRLLSPLKWLICSLVMIAWLPIINFSTDFVKLHQILFTNQDWIFSVQNDPIILLMPEQFFWQLFIMTVLIALGLLVILWGWLLLASGAFLTKLRTDKANYRRNQGYHDNSEDDN